MFDDSQFNSLSKPARDTIVRATLLEAHTRVKQPHSIGSIVSQSRELAIGARMTATPLSFTDDHGIDKVYSGQDIAQIFWDSVQMNGRTYYPVTGDWTKRDPAPRLLILFVKTEAKYVPFVRFDIVRSICADQYSQDQLLTLTDSLPMRCMKFKTLLEVNNSCADFAPNISFLGAVSGRDIYESTFRGGQPNPVII